MFKARSTTLRATHLLCVLPTLCCGALGCAGSDGSEGPSGPATNRMFVSADANGVRAWVEDPVAFAMAGGRMFFDDTSCWLPDADSFDDYEDMAEGIPRGVTPVPSSCTADGIETGPLQFEASGDPMDLLPSKWCPSPRADCMPVQSSSEGGGY